MAQSIYDLKGDARIVLIFAASDIDTDLMAAQREFDGALEGVKERDLRIFIVSEETGVEEWPEARPDSPKMDAASLHARYDVADGDFAIVLIGKDGSEKYRSDRVVPADDIFAVIDEMPMRQDEMKSD